MARYTTQPAATATTADAPKPEAIAALRAGLRDIPVYEDPDGPSVSLPAEMADAIALHLWHFGARVVVDPDREWAPPEHGDEHSLNPGKWVAR